MARGTWTVRVALFVALAGTGWGMTVMVSSASDIGVSLQPAAASERTGTWAVAPQGSGTTFARQTLRQIVHTSIGGTLARVHLSNVFGTRPLAVADVHIADARWGSSVDPASDRVVTFGGQPTTTIPVGGSVASDQVSLSVAAQSDVAVSVYLPQGTGPAAAHQLGLRIDFGTFG